MHFKAITLVIAITTVPFFNSDGELITGLRNTESKVGETTYFNCATNLTSKQILWRHGEHLIFTGILVLKPYYPRFTVEREALSGSSSLVIHSVEPGDAGEYSCVDDDGAGARRSAQLIVLDNAPDCQSNIQPDGVIGQNAFNITPDEVQLTCTVTYHGNIPPQLEWKMLEADGFVLDNATSSSASDNSFTHILKFKGDISLDNSSFACQTTRSTQNQYKCTSENIKVLYLLGSNTSVQHIFRGDNLTCNISSSLSSCKKQWYHDNKPCPLSCDQTFTPHFLGKYLCRVTCPVRGRDHIFDALEATVGMEETPPPSTCFPWGMISYTFVIAVYICVPIKQCLPDSCLKGIAAIGVIALVLILPAFVGMIFVMYTADQAIMEVAGTFNLWNVVNLLLAAGVICVRNVGLFGSRTKGIRVAAIVLLLVDLLAALVVLSFTFAIAYKQAGGFTGVLIFCIVNMCVILATFTCFLVKLLLLEKQGKDAAKRYSVQEADVNSKRTWSRPMTLCEGTSPIVFFISFGFLLQVNQLAFLITTNFELKKGNAAAVYIWFLIHVFQSALIVYLFYDEYYKKNTAAQNIHQQTSIMNMLAKKVFIRADEPGMKHNNIAGEEIELLHKIKSDPTYKEKPITGVTILNGKLFLVLENSSNLEVYDCTTFSRYCQSLTLEFLVSAFDMCSCNKNNCLYIMDKRCSEYSKTVLKISTDGRLIKSWTTPKNVLGHLSVTPEGNLFITVQAKHTLYEYSDDGKLLNCRQLTRCINPWHAIKIDNGRYIVSHGTLFDRCHRVCRINEKRIADKSFGCQIGSAKNQLNMPIYMAVGSNGCVMVADLCNNRVMLLDSNLEFKATLVPKYNQGFLCPQRLHLDENLGLLVVVIAAGDPKKTLLEDAAEQLEDGDQLSENTILLGSGKEMEMKETVFHKKAMPEKEEGLRTEKVDDCNSTDNDIIVETAEKRKTKQVETLKQIEEDCRVLVFDIKPILEKYKG